MILKISKSRIVNHFNNYRFLFKNILIYLTDILSNKQVEQNEISRNLVETFYYPYISEVNLIDRLHFNF